jgi:hypothetical protein
MKRLFDVSISELVGSSAMTTPVLAGTKDASYGAQAAVQAVETGFGDNPRRRCSRARRWSLSPTAGFGNRGRVTGG